MVNLRERDTQYRHESFTVSSTGELYADDFPSLCICQLRAASTDVLATLAIESAPGGEQPLSVRIGEQVIQASKLGFVPGAAGRTPRLLADGIWVATLWPDGWSWSVPVPLDESGETGPGSTLLIAGSGAGAFVPEVLYTAGPRVRLSDLAARVPALA